MYRIVKQVRRKNKTFTKPLKVIMVIFGVLFILMGIMISQAYMLSGFLLVVLYFVYDIFSQRDYEYVMEDECFTIDLIRGKRYRKTVHELDLKDLEVVAPHWHDAVADYRRDAGSIRLPKFDYTSYEDDIPYYTMIILEGKKKIKLLLDLDGEMLGALKKAYPSKVFLS